MAFGVAILLAGGFSSVAVASDCQQMMDPRILAGDNIFLGGGVGVGRLFEVDDS
jgi:hypothetical protein